MQKDPAAQTEPEQQELSDETAKDLLELIPDKKLEVQKGALSIMLQFTNNSHVNSRKLLELSVVPQLLKQVFNPNLTTLCLTNLINFSSFIAEGDELSPEIVEQFVNTAKPILLQIKSWTGLENELALLYLTNLTKLEQVSVGVILGEGDTKGYFIEVLANQIDNSPHLCNILSNISSFKDTREFLTSDGGVFTCRLQRLLYSPVRDVRVSTLKVLRNLLFEFENEKFVDGILQAERHFIDGFGAYFGGLLVHGRHLITTPADKESLRQKLPTYAPLFKGIDIPLTSQSSAELAEVELAVECLLIMNNIDMAAKKPEYSKQQFKEVIGRLQILPLQQEVKDKLQFVQVFFS